MRKLSTLVFVVVSVCCFFWISSAKSAIYPTYWYVDCDVASSGNGESWEEAFKTIQEGINAASEDDIVLVADGLYQGNGNRDLDFDSTNMTVQGYYGAASTIIDPDAGGFTWRRGFYFHNGEDSTSVVDGFTITNGRDLNGGAIYCNGASPTIKNCILENNDNPLYYKGGAICCNSSANATIENCIIRSNSASYGGGGIACINSSPTIKDCEIYSNSSSLSGGAIYCYNQANPAIKNCLIYENSATTHGAGIACHLNSDPVLTNCTIATNSATYWGGGVYTSGSGTAPEFRNTIIWDNAGSSGDEIYASLLTTVTLNYCCYANETGDVGGSGTVSPSNCTTDDPLFLDTTNGDYHLPRHSPCTDVGNNNLVSPGNILDLYGDPRIADGDHNGIETVDIGAYEYPFPAREAKDGSGFIISHPFFEEHYDVIYTPDNIPAALDIEKTTLEFITSVWKFTIYTYGNIPELFTNYPDEAQFSLSFDTDCNNQSNYILYTLFGGTTAIMADSYFEYIETLSVNCSGNTLTIEVPESLIGDNFDWVVRSGFTLSPGEPFTTPLEDLFVAPVVDMAYFRPLATIFSPSEIAEGSVMMVFAQLASQMCKTEAEKKVDLNPDDEDNTKKEYNINNKGENDWCIHAEYFEWVDDDPPVTRKVAVQVWLIDNSPDNAHSTSNDYYAVLVFEDLDGDHEWDPPGERGGWIGVCPYAAAVGTGPDKDPRNKNVKVKLTVSDKESDVAQGDHDDDGKKDEMTYEYDHSTGELKVTNTETDEEGNVTSADKTYDEPFSDLDNVPRKKENWQEE